LIFCIYREFRLERKFAYKIDENWFFLKQGFIEDSIIIGTCLLVYMITSSIRNRTIEIFGKCIISLCFFVYCFDIVLFKLLGTRLLLSDVVKFSQDINDVVSIMSQMAISSEGILVVIFSIILIVTSYYFIRKREYIPPNNRFILSTIAIGLILLSSQMSDPQYCHAWLYKNVFSINSSNTVNNSYSDSFSRQLLQQSPEADALSKVATGRKENPNIIIVAIESLSAYQSNYFSGLNNMTPNLDRIAREGRSFTNFYANGFTTEGGLISILTGVSPIPCPASFSNEMKGLFSFEGFYNPPKSLPAMLNNEGYHSEFITTGRTSYSNKINWLSNIGFNVVTGDENPDYDGWPRYKFNAAPDEALYLHVLNRINEYSDIKPYFYFIENVSTHFPFLNPETNEQTEDAAFLYGDQQIGMFVDKLKELNFFDNGILIITGDHRTMTPISKDEFEFFGESAPARVPLIVLDRSISKNTVISETFQHTDFISSVECLVSDRCETTMFSGDFLSQPPTPSSAIIAVNGSDRNVVNLYTENSFSQILLDGDSTKFISGTASQQILNKINRERITHLKYGMSTEQ
jgi:phosphoglycerol transferase MdoB-like AlkP superfamily enzyme